MKILRCLALIALSLAFGNIHAQTSAKQIATQHSIWYGYYLTLEFSPKWRLVSEVQERHFVEPFAQHQWLARTRLYRSLGKNWEAALGFVHFWSNPNDPCTTGDCLTVPELRPYQEFGYRQTLGGGWTLRHRYMVEERFVHKSASGVLVDGYNFSWRFRYQIGADYELFKLKSSLPPVRLRLNTEVLANAGKSIGDNVFDQWRGYGGFLFPLSDNISVELGYLYQLQQRTSGEKFYERNILRFGLNHRIKA